MDKWTIHTRMGLPQYQKQNRFQIWSLSVCTMDSKIVQLPGATD